MIEYGSEVAEPVYFIQMLLGAVSGSDLRSCRSLLLVCFIISTLIRLFALVVFLIWHDDASFLVSAT